ncbi:class I mannose-6-phosphate isomerase [Lachnospiraceae bacterium 54-11]
MAYLTFQSEYDKSPETKVSGYDNQAWKGWNQIALIINEISLKNNILIVDCYPGTDDTEVLLQIQEAFLPELTVNMEDVFFAGEKLTELMAFHLTEDRVRGIMYYGSIMDFIHPQKLENAKAAVKNCHGRVLIYGFGASLVSEEGSLVYADMTRWEIQLRYRKGMPNYKQTNYQEDNLKKYKRGFFVEWRIADKHKASLYDKMDFYLDTNTKGHPAMVTGDGFRCGLQQVTEQPFRLVPYFDPGVWGGQWMKEVCRLNQDESNYAWAFDGVPEENSLYLNYGGVRIESPAMNLILYQPRETLGEKNYARFGAEFPIRFDFLDTMDGQNLSLQVHPLTDYIHRKFGMAYTQDESYYILDTGEGGGVYLGLKENINNDQMIKDLEEAQQGGDPFDAEKYVNFFPAKKHDHFLIPAGTIHCSSKNCMVLEVSATPYIFTFKLWDWGRVGLDGRPRPIHIEDGKNVLQFNRTTSWVKDNLLNSFQELERNSDYMRVRTGLHELEFIETEVLTVHTKAPIGYDGEMSMCNLVDGKAAIIESIDNAFPSYCLHYAETVILPAKAGQCSIRPAVPGEDIKFLKASIRHCTGSR